jgi:metallo-beta-lactamase family protein
MLPQARHTVVLVGFQAPGTRGRDLVDGVRSLRMHGLTVPVRAEVCVVEGLSVHADSDELVAWIAAAEEPPGRVLVMHGEPAASAHLAGRVREELGWPVEVLVQDEAVEIAASASP